MHRRLDGGLVFDIFNYLVLSLLALACILPMIHVVALSFSNNAVVSAGWVTLWPIRFTTTSYRYVIEKPLFWSSFTVSLKRVFLGLLINSALTVMAAYALSKEATEFKARTLYAWLFFITMLFGGGLIPTYLVVSKTGLINTIWALVIPGAVPIFNVILLLNFFRAIPKDLSDAACIDGAGHVRILYSIYLPVSLPALATISLYIIVGHWNSWFDGMIYMDRPETQPLQTYLRSILIQKDLAQLTMAEWRNMNEISNRTIKAAQIFLAAIPVLCVYPFLQRYFVKGIMIGSVKG